MAGASGGDGSSMVMVRKLWKSKHKLHHAEGRAFVKVSPASVNVGNVRAFPVLLKLCGRIHHSYSLSKHVVAKHLPWFLHGSLLIIEMLLHLWVQSVQQPPALRGELLVVCPKSSEHKDLCGVGAKG